MPWRFQARYALLTYAQCGDLDPWQIVDHLSGLGAECIIGREHHADEGLHLHCFVDFGQKYRSSDNRLFDVDGRHPNILGARKTPEKMFDYATKEGDIVAGGLARPCGGGSDRQPNRWHEITMAEDEAEFFDRCAELDPRALCVNFNSLRAYALWRYKPMAEHYRHPAGIDFDLRECPMASAWRDEVLRAEHTGTFGGAPAPSTPWRTHPLLGVWAVQSLAPRGALRPYLRYAPVANRRGGPTASLLI